MSESKVVSAKISSDDYLKVKRIAEENGQTVSSAVILLLKGLISGEIELVGGEIRVGEHEIYGSNDEILEDESEYRKYGYEKMTRMFLKKKYPEGTYKEIDVFGNCVLSIFNFLISFCLFNAFKISMYNSLVSSSDKSSKYSSTFLVSPLFNVIAFSFCLL